MGNLLHNQSFRQGWPMRYLTKSYVEALGLPEVQGHTSEPMAGWVSEEAVMPEHKIIFVTGVIYKDAFYKRSLDGLSYDLPLAPAHFR